MGKYEISEEDYLKRDNNFRAWKAEQLKKDPTWSFSKQVKLQQDAKRKEKDPNYVPEPEKQPVTDDEHLADLAAAMKVGDRCEVNPGGKRGEVKFLGKIPAIAPGWWAGCTTSQSARTTARARASATSSARPTLAASCGRTRSRSATTPSSTCSTRKRRICELFVRKSSSCFEPKNGRGVEATGRL